MAASAVPSLGDAAVDKASAYRAALEQIAAVLEGEADRTARMATVAALLAETFAQRFSWTGFYVVDPARERELVVCPYKGRMGCLRIGFDRGVCGAAARTSALQVV